MKARSEAERRSAPDGWIVDLMRGRWQVGWRLLVFIFLWLLIFSFIPVVFGEEPVRFQALTWGSVSMTGKADTKVLPGGSVSVDGPLAAGHASIARVYATLSLTSEPGVSVQLDKPETFGKAAELSLGTYKRIGELQVGDQHVTTSVFAEWGFATTLDSEPLDRYLRHYGGGFRVAEDKSGAELRLGYGRHEAGGDFGNGQWIISGRVPVALGKAVVLGGDAVLSVGKARTDRPLRQRDVLRLYVGVSIPDLFKK